MIKVTLHISGEPTHTAPATLLGHNLEAAGDTVAGLLTERLNNPKFRGPADPLTGIAPGWQPGMHHNIQGMRFELTSGLSLSGQESQLIHNYSGRQSIGLVQTERWLRAGERLEVRLWARAQHHPVTLRAGIRPMALQAPIYDATPIPITATYWKEYRATLTSPRDDEHAMFTLFLEEPGLVWLDQVHLQPEGMGALRPDLIAAIRTLDIPVLRFPGGCISTNYHWRHGTGPVHLRPNLQDPVFKWEMAYEFGTDEYLALCHELGIQPHITINIGSGTPDEAGAWAAYCAAWFKDRGLELPTIYWQMGNEHYGAWELGNMSGELYAAALREFVPAVRRAYPRARIIALGPETGEGLQAGERLPWREPVLEKAGDLVDLLALQWYASGWNEDMAIQQANALKGARDLGHAIRRASADCQRHGLPTKVAVTEWNFWLRAAHYDGGIFLEPYDVQHGLFVSAVLHHFTRLAPGLELGNFYHLVNPMGIFISRGPAIQETPLADVFRLYRPAFPGQVVPLEVISPPLAEDIPTVDAACLRTPEADWLFLANRSLSESAEVDAGDFAPCDEVLILSGESPQGHFEHEQATVKGGQVILPPLSIVRLRKHRP